MDVPKPGRSLWADARARLMANRAAMVSIVYLALMTVLCIAGPWLTPHDFTTIFQDYNRVPPSLSAYPTKEMLGPALVDAVKRARVELADWKEEGEGVVFSVTSAKPIDERLTRYIDRSNVYEGAQVVEKSADGTKMTLSAGIERNYFYFGTDNSGRDLLTRTLIAGRVSLSIGLLAGLVAVAIGVLYGASAGFIGGKTDEIMMRIVDILYSLPFIFFVIMLVVFFGRNFVLMFLAVGAFEWLTMARIVRGQVQSLRHVDQALEAGAAAIVAQGSEAGGHGAHRATLPFVPEVADHLAARSPGTLLLAAGGIADGRGLAAALMLGADGVVVGTRFWASAEALTPQAMIERAVRATGDDTVRTTAIDSLRGVAWPPEFSFRVVRNRLTDYWSSREREAAAAFGSLAAAYAEARSRQDLEMVATVAGECVGLIRDRPSAAAIVDSMVAQAETLLARDSSPV